MPERVGSGRNLRITCTIQNGSPHVLRTTPPHPVYLFVRWRGAGGVELPGDARIRRDPAWIPIPPIWPDESAEVEIVAPTPWAPGAYELSIGLVQRAVGWLPDADPRTGTSETVIVEPGPG